MITWLSHRRAVITQIIDFLYTVSVYVCVRFLLLYLRHGYKEFYICVIFSDIKAIRTFMEVYHSLRLHAVLLLNSVLVEYESVDVACYRKSLMRITGSYS